MIPREACWSKTQASLVRLDTMSSQAQVKPLQVKPKRLGSPLGLLRALREVDLGSLHGRFSVGKTLIRLRSRTVMTRL